MKKEEYTVSQWCCLWFQNNQYKWNPNTKGGYHNLIAHHIPAVERMHTTMKKYQVAFTETTSENKRLKNENVRLEKSLGKATEESTLKQLADAKLRRDYADAVAVLECIPKEVLDVYARGGHGRKERPIEQNL